MGGAWGIQPVWLTTHKPVRETIILAHFNTLVVIGKGREIRRVRGQKENCVIGTELEEKGGRGGKVKEGKRLGAVENSLIGCRLHQRHSAAIAANRWNTC